VPSRHELGPALRLQRIEPKPKRVHKLPGFDQSVVARGLTDPQLDQLALIEHLIATGQRLDRFYRASNRRDELLRRHGVLHLHLDHPGSNVLLYLVQFRDHVLLICVGGHGFLDSVPVGANLPTFKIKNWIANLFPRWMASNQRSVPGQEDDLGQ
jgi:hypothetical protein